MLRLSLDAGLVERELLCGEAGTSVKVLLGAYRVSKREEEVVSKVWVSACAHVRLCALEKRKEKLFSVCHRGAERGSPTPHPHLPPSLSPLDEPKCWLSRLVP